MHQSLCVFCGSSSGHLPELPKRVNQIGKVMAKNSIRLIYGGASIGLMGQIAQGCLDNDGEVIGVIPKKLLQIEIAHQGLTKLHVVDSMHERKLLMYQLSEAFVALPGGFGTLDELFEILTWKQLALHQKPIYLVNINNFFSPLISMIESMNRKGFLSEQHKNYLKVVEDFNQILQ